MKSTALGLLLPLMSTAANYSAQKSTDHEIEVVRLSDAAHKTEVSIAPSFGNMAYEMKVNGKDTASTRTRIGRTARSICSIPIWETIAMTAITSRSTACWLSRRCGR
jgi:hypothetical protein